jgi:dihydroceramidase
LNYEVSDYIVEFWNTMSSLSFVVIGLLNLFLLRALKGTAKEIWISILYIIVGLGSAAFHGTLKFTYQLWDEIPMVWVISS